MPCYQKQTDENPCSESYLIVKTVEVPCPPDVVCNDDTVDAGPLGGTVELLCRSGGVRVTVTTTGAVGLVKYSLDGSPWQSSNVFNVVQMPTGGLVLKIWDTSEIGRIKEVNTGTIDCSESNGEYTYLYTYYKDEYCPDGVTVYAQAKIDVYTNGKQQREKVVDVVGKTSCNGFPA